MYLNRYQRLALPIDPGVAERERQDIAHHQRRARLVDQLDRAAAGVARLEAMVAEGIKVRKGRMATAANRLAHFTAAAERAGLIRTRKEPA